VAEPLETFRLDYTPLMLRYLSQRDETGLGCAYELGREALRQSVSLLDVVQVHHELFLDVLATVRDTEEAHSLAVAASDLLMDLIAAFEMSQRAAMESRLVSPTGAIPTPRSEPDASR
jgi:Phosphoserine phosphatase RsbU, N-terminal domain